MERKPVDIIIPIYNAYLDLVKCINSVKKHTDLTLDRLILINDCSPDEHIAPYLESIKEENILVINNEKNKGFSGNVNLGMSLSNDRDVILLNSDTIVTFNWVNKIYNCAYSKPEIGTVTPMSNSATLCSTPIMCQDNDIPNGFTVEEYAGIVERCSMHKYPRITVAVGFCMFIKRQVIKEVGWFDAETFERGYGEENDFCNRAEQLGYIHVMCDDTLIYHKGTVSFVSEEKQKLIDAHDKILQERYPAQMLKNHLYCVTNPDQYIRDNIKLYADIENKKHNILYLLHLDFREDAVNSVGGTQLHVKDLVDGLKYQYNVFVMARVRDKLRLSIYIDEGVKTLEFYVGEADATPRFVDSIQKNIYENVLKAFKIELIHIHHIQGLSFDIFDVAKELGIPTYVTLHDYYYICPNEKLYSTGVGCCASKELFEAKKEILVKSRGIAQTVPFMPKWTKRCREILKQCTRLITPSNAARKIYIEHYPELKDKIDVIPHGYEFKECIKIAPQKTEKSEKIKYCLDSVFDDQNKKNISGWCFLEGVNTDKTSVYIEIKDKNGKTDYVKAAKNGRPDVAQAFGNDEYMNSGFSFELHRDRFPDGKLDFRILLKDGAKWYELPENITYKNRHVTHEDKFNVAFVGGMAEAKGSAEAAELILKSPDNINWFVIGNIGDEKLEGIEKTNYIKTGGYVREELPNLMEYYGVDLVCVLSPWPETFCYTISEALMCHIPVLVTNIGAMAERIENSGYGWLVEPGDVENTLELINRLSLDENGEYSRTKAVVEKYTGISCDDMCHRYSSLYENDFITKNSGQDFDTEMIWKALDTTV